MSTERPLHTRAFRLRRFINWFPMGLTYAFLYMGRYNLTISKNALGDLMSKSDFGIIFFWGTITYAFAFLINGPLTDRLGGRKGMLFASFGAATMNLLLGVSLYLMLNKQFHIGMIVIIFSILYSFNMYFQSFGAVSIVKVNSHWFHVRERGVFGGIFGILISLGIYFAFDWGNAIIEATKAVVQTRQLNWVQEALRYILQVNGTIDETWWVFLIPAMLLYIFFFIELFILRNSPGEAGHRDFDTADASSGEEHIEFTVLQIIKKILTNPIIITVALIEFCTGVLRNGVMHWYLIYAKEKLLPAAQFMLDNWGLILMIAGSTGGIVAGVLSDKIFGSRRAPVATLFYGLILLCTIGMSFSLNPNLHPFILGSLVTIISFAVIGTHGMLSGTATMDFGGRKGAATAVGLIDGFVYLGTGFQSISLGFITEWNWAFWPVFLIPFALLGIYLLIRIWDAFPKAKLREQKSILKE
jgi:OPA family glycerol-3-phosphate transporter-like MFS transporter